MSISKNNTLNYAEELFSEGKFAEAFPILEIIEKEVDITSQELLRCQILKIKLLIALERLEEGIKLSEQILKDNNSLNNSFAAPDILILKAGALWWLGNWKQG